MSDNDLIQPESVLVVQMGNGMTLRMEARTSHISASLYRGRYLTGQRVALFLAMREDAWRIRLDKSEVNGAESLWFPSANIELSPTAARRIAKWLATHGIGQGAASESGATDALDDLALNTDTPAPAAPGGTP